MNVIVFKFGGSSIADAAGFRRVRAIIAPLKCRQYIILSAPGRRNSGDAKITDLLVSAHDGNAGAVEIIRKRFAEIIGELKIDIDPERFLASLEQDVRISRDHAASRGEYFCARLFAAYAGIPFVDAAELIRFDANGRVQQEATTLAIRAMCEKYPCAVIPGFYGSLPDGRIKTFARGGSDITGALVAAALSAELYENWTDVDGLMSIDPNISENAVHHPAVSYRQMRRLSLAGAQVLHPDCLEPVCEAGIPTVLKNTFHPDRTGTYISDRIHATVRCVCAHKNIRAVFLDDLSCEARQIAQGLSADEYIGRDGQRVIAVRDFGSLGTTAEIISAFGLSAEDRQKARARFSPIAELHDAHSSRYLVRPETSHQVQRILHDMTISSPETRIP